MANRLADETSPYLLQHQHNPVDWYPWGEEAFARARSEDRPLLVSIGYSACHWCHVMERESFEDPATAELMNELFVCIKVDREERPDVDAIYMEACQTMTGQGGWPLNAFIGPDQVPFYVGTYFPPEPRHGMPSWTTVLRAVADAWTNRRAEIDEQAGRLTAALGASTRIKASPDEIDDQQLTQAAGKLVQSYDWEHGGWGGAPKFPMSASIEFLLARGLPDAPLHALRAMAEGGIYDQVGGGFARYAVDATWTVPHFEKMLYDNALLARSYLHGFQVSGDERLAEVCRETLDWALREMRGPEGGFCSALDADSEGVEGKFYAWSLDELRAVLGADADEAVAYFGATERGNFEHGLNVLEARGPRPAHLAEIRRKLFEARAGRVRPGLDDKRLTAWNALMISALADAGAVLQERSYLQAAAACADFLLRESRDERGHLLRTWKGGRGRLSAYLEDHAFLLEALLTLYEASFDPRWYEEAVALAEQIIERFHDDERGGFFTTASDHEQLLLRRKDLEDSPIPSGSSSAAFGLLRLAALSGERRYEERGREVLALVFALAFRHPGAFGHLLRAADFYAAPTREVAIVGNGDSAQALVGVVRERLRPHLVVAAAPSESPEPVVPLLADRPPGPGGAAAAYVCQRFACQAPVSDPDALRALL